MAKEYIEREVLIKACEKIIQDRWNETTAPVSWSHAYADFIDDINEQSAADVAPVKHGEWFGTVCTACGESTSFYYDCRYCPNCGAKTDGLNKE